MDARQSPGAAEPAQASPQGDTPRAWPVVERALLRLAADLRLTSALTQRLVEVASGLSRRQISELHGTSANTVKAQVSALLGSLGVTCCHEVRDAARAACARAQAGAGEDEVLAFLRLRFE